MIVSDAITRLANTELKQLSVKTDTAAMLVYLNEAVLALHTRFNLWEDEATLVHATGVTEYDLDGVDGNVTIDLSDKQMIAITRGVDFNDDEIKINDPNDAYLTTTPKYNKLKFALAELEVGETFTFTFRASPLDMTIVGDTINIPPQLNECLYTYVSFLGHVSQTGDAQSESNMHFKRYLHACDRAEGTGLINTTQLDSGKFEYTTYPWP